MKKTKSYLSIFFILIFLGTFISTNLLKPSKVFAMSQNDLASRAHTILKLEAFKRCSNEELNWNGITKGKGPLNLSFVVNYDIKNKPVGYGVNRDGGTWDCGSQDGSREDTYFKLLLRNGSKDKYYSGWDSGSYRYNGADSKNLKDVNGDDKLYFINPNNEPGFNLSGSKAIDSAAKAHAKINDQIDKSIAKQEDGMNDKEKSAMLYASLADTFFSKNACNSTNVDQNDPGEKVKIGNLWYIIPEVNSFENSGGLGGLSPISTQLSPKTSDYSVGYGKYGWDEKGAATCKDIAKKMDRHNADYVSVTGDKGPIPKGTANGTAGDPASTTNNIETKCTVTSDFITWIMCPLIEGFTLAVETLDTQITNLLNIDTNEYFGDGPESSGPGFKEVWTNVRTISVGFLVIMALIMIISTAISVGPFDAYTVKKVMPRLIIVIVLISISWPLVIFLIEMSNALGFAVRGLIQAPFVAQGVIKINEGEQAVAGVALLGGGFALGLPGLLSFLVTAFMAVMIAFFVLILRQIVIVLLAIIAPIALVSYILPNTSKFGKFWWDSFSKALIAFPIISGFIAIGRVFASVSYNVGGPVSGYIAFISYFAPYFLIPQAFKMAGGVLGNLSGMVNDRGRGAFDRLKKFRQGQTKKNWDNTLNQRRFNPTGRLGGLNKAAQFGAMVGSGKAGLDPRRMAGKVGAQTDTRELNEAEHLIRENDEVKAIYNDDHLLTAASTMRGRDNIRNFLTSDATNGRFANLSAAELDQTVTMVEAAQKAGSRGAIEMVSAIGHAQSGTGGSAAQLLSEAAGASHGNQNLRNRIIAAQSSAAANSRRPDYTAVGHTEREDLARQLQEGTLTEAQVEAQMLTRSLATTGAHGLVGMREEPFRHMVTQLGSDYIAARNSGNIPLATELASQITSFRGAMGSAPPENRAHISTMLDAVGVDSTAINPGTGAAISTDEQLGAAIADRGLTGFTTPTQRLEAQQRTTQEIRTRAGLYDAGGGNRTPDQIRAASTGAGGAPTT